MTLKTDPDPGTVDIVSLDDGRVTGAVPTAVSAPQGTLTPFGFAVYRDGTAVITLAHSNQDGLFRNGAFTSVVDAGQAADCWMTRVGKYVFTANTGSKTISRLIGTGSHVFVDSQVAAAIATGGAPADIDADAGVSRRDRPRRRPVSLVAVQLQRVRRTHRARGADHGWRGRRERRGDSLGWRPGSKLNASTQGEQGVDRTPRYRSSTEHDDSHEPRSFVDI